MAHLKIYLNRCLKPANKKLESDHIFDGLTTGQAETDIYNLSLYRQVNDKKRVKNE
jgi:hypothetical protein